MDPLNWLNDELDELRAAHLYRRRVATRCPAGPLVEIDGRSYLNFASNDYLGLAADPRLAARARDAMDGWGSAASPLVTGYCDEHARLEQALADFEAAEAALVFASGYAANVGAITALVGRGDVVFSDEFNHASIIDGCRLSRATICVYRHGDMSMLQEQLRLATSARRKLIVSDSLFSMDGDLAPVVDLVELAERHAAMLMLDEAHATGVCGPHGRGVAEHLGVHDRVPIRVGTLSKAIGSAGGFVCGSRALVDWLVNRARPYIFSTAPPAAAAAAAQAALEIIAAEPQRRVELQSRAARLRETLARQGWNVGTSASQVIPVVTGDESTALALASSLRERGIWAPAIRPPSVPAGTSRLRISLSYAHTPEMVARLVAAMSELARLAAHIAGSR